MLNTELPTAPDFIDDTAKVNVVDPSFKAHPATVTSLNRPPTDEERDRGNRKAYKERVRKDFDAAERRGMSIWENMKERILRPGVAGGLLGVGRFRAVIWLNTNSLTCNSPTVNLGLLCTLGYKLYTEPHLRSDRRLLGWSATGALVVLGAEGFLAESYRNTPEGAEEERRARAEGAAVYRHAKEVVLRPQVFGGLMGTCRNLLLICTFVINFWR